VSEPDRTAGQWEQLRGGLPDHETEVMAAHQSTWPSVAWQNQHNGAPAPEPDNGPDPGSVI
jgi:hypothetical protein